MTHIICTFCNWLFRLSPSVVRELTYTSIRSGFYEPIKVMLGGVNRHDTPLHIKMKAGALAGFTMSLETEKLLHTVILMEAGSVLFVHD